MAYRKSVSKSKYKKDFKKSANSAKAINFAPPPMRGGYRM